jgi:hypothetical protein
MHFLAFADFRFRRCSEAIIQFLRSTGIGGRFRKRGFEENDPGGEWIEIVKYRYGAWTEIKTISIFFFLGGGGGGVVFLFSFFFSLFFFCGVYLFCISLLVLYKWELMRGKRDSPHEACVFTRGEGIREFIIM